MTTYTLEKMLTAELSSLNRAIDRKIMLGLPYSREARDHRLVLAKLMRLKRSSGSSLFSRFNFASGLFR
jgi:hypothetical protein